MTDFAAKLQAAHNAAGPSAEELQAGGSRWLRSGSQWPAERQIAFNAAVMELVEALHERSEQQQSRIAELEQQIAATLTQQKELRTAIATELLPRSEAQEQMQQLRLDQAQSREQLREELSRDVGERDDRLAADLGHEQRERIQHVLDEQRVCLRQLSLEHSEQAVLADRARRATELLLDELTRRVDQIAPKTAA